MLKYKKLTNKEKSLRREVRKDMVEMGVLPPPKQRLNRKKFISETREEFNQSMNNFESMRYVFEAISWLLPTGEGKYTKITAEEVGVAKILKLSMELKKFHKSKIDSGETEYKLMDLYNDIISPILKMWKVYKWKSRMALKLNMLPR